jgi:hypothetical protein
MFRSLDGAGSAVYIRLMSNAPTFQQGDTVMLINKINRTKGTLLQDPRNGRAMVSWRDGGLSWPSVTDIRHA